MSMKINYFLLDNTVRRINIIVLISVTLATSLFIFSNHTASAADIRLAVIGDSYTVGIGDSCDQTSCTYAQPGMTGYASGANNGIPYPITNSEPLRGCNQYAGWVAKLAYKLQLKGHNVSVSHVCAMNGARSDQLYALNCGQTIANLNPAPTHTLIYAGINDGGQNKDAAFTWYWVNQIGGQLANSPTRKIHIQGNGESKGPNWDQLVTGFLAGNVNHTYPNVKTIPQVQCNAHPLGSGYWTLSENILNAVQW